MHTSIETSPRPRLPAQNGASSQRDDALIGTRETVRNPNSNGHEEIPAPSPANRARARNAYAARWGALAALIVAAGAGFYYFHSSRRMNPATMPSSRVTSFHQRQALQHRGGRPDHDNDQVKKGQLLVQIDPRDYEVALRSARPAMTRRRVTTTATSPWWPAAPFPNRTWTPTHAALKTPRRSWTKPSFNLEYTRITAPTDGKITRKNVEPGGVRGGRAASLRPWAERNVGVANFKETQLTHMRVGQKAEVKVDAYPQYTAHRPVESIQSGSGRFSLFPPRTPPATTSSRPARAREDRAG